MAGLEGSGAVPRWGARDTADVSGLAGIDPVNLLVY